MNRRRFLGFVAGAAAAPVVAKIAPLGDGVALTSMAHPTTVHYPSAGHVFDAKYVWREYGVTIRVLLPTEEQREAFDRLFGRVDEINEAVLETVTIKLPGPSAVARDAFRRFDERAQSLS